MLDYEKIADQVHMPGIEPEAPAPRQFFPVNHEKYQGLAEARGYEQTPNRLKRIRYSHEAMIDMILAEPTIKGIELAERFGHTQAWISVIIGSDAFQAALAKRREELTDPFLVATIEERFRGLAHQSLEVIAKKLEATENIDVALKALDISSKALGFGARGSSSANVQNNFVVQLPAKISSASDWAAQHTLLEQ